MPLTSQTSQSQHFPAMFINLLDLLLLYNRRLQHLLQFDGRVIYRTYTTAPYRIIEERFI